MDLQHIHPGIASTEELLRLMTRYQPTNPHHALGFKPGQWFECSECDFWYFLGSNPPLAHTGPSFALEEFVTGNLTHSFHRIGGRFFCMVIAYQSRATVAAAAAALAAEISASKRAR